MWMNSNDIDGGEKYLRYDHVIIDIHRIYMTEKIIEMEKNGWYYTSSLVNVFDDDFIVMSFIRDKKKKRRMCIIL
jgi:hypothetical protein